MRAIPQDAFLGRGTHSPLIDILNHIGLRYDENAPSEVTDEMMRLVGPDSTVLQLEEQLSALQTELGEKYGKASWATGADKTKYSSLQIQLKVAKQRHGRRILGLFRKDHFTTKNNEELGRQLSSETQTQPAAPQEIRPVYFTVPERRKLAALFGNFDDELSEDIIVRKKIDATIALIRYAWIVETKDQALLLDPQKPQAVDHCGPRKRPWFASMIREPAVLPTKHPEPRREESYVAPASFSPSPPVKEHFICMFCGKVVRRKATMWNCVDRHLAKVLTGTGVVACPRPECEMEDAFHNEVDFKYHSSQCHRIHLRPPRWESSSETGLPSLPSEADCSLRTSPTLSVPYVEDTADMDAPFCLGRWGRDISTSEANELGTTPYPEPPDTIASSGRPEEHGWDLSTQFTSPIPHSGEYPEPGSEMSTSEEGSELWEQLQTSSQHSPDDLQVYEQLEETEWDNMASPLPSYEMGGADDAGRSPMLAAQAVHLQAVSTFMESHLEIHSVGLFDPALRDHDTSRNTLPTPRDMVMEDSTSIFDNEKDYPVETVLEKRGDMFYLQWKDGTCSWQHRNDVSDDLIDPFEASWKGYHSGVTVLYKKPAGRAPFRLRFKDWPWENATIWATYKELSPGLRAQWPSKPRRRGRRSVH
jgi:hypothetical protein